MKVRMAGLGGQGQVTAGILLGHAAVIEGKDALQTQSYGSATRGGLTTCDIAIGDSVVYEVNPEKFDILVAFCQEAYDTYLPLLADDGVLLYEGDLVTTDERLPGRHAALASTRLAKDELGRTIVSNVVMLGFLVGAVPGLVEATSLEAALADQLKAGIVKLNHDAFRLGYDAGRAAIS
jgi:2-oxoglutarate ferredoxin oxidoreductase subunit gamma